MELYVAKFTGLDGRSYTLSIEDPNYNGESKECLLSPDGFVIEEPMPDRTTEPIVASTARITFIDRGEFAGFSVSGLRQYLVRLTSVPAGSLYPSRTEWMGYLSPEVYDLPVFTLPGRVSFNANSASALMSRLQITDGAGLSTFGELLQACYNACGFSAGVIDFDTVAWFEDGCYNPRLSMWRLRASRSLWATQVENDCDETELPSYWDGETWSAVIGDVLRYFGLTMHECWGVSSGLLLLSGPTGNPMADYRTRMNIYDFFSATGKSPSGSYNFNSISPVRKALTDLPAGGTGNHTSLMSCHTGAKVHASVLTYPSPVMQQSNDSDTVIIMDSLDFALDKDSLVGRTTWVCSGNLRNCGSSPSLYGADDIRFRVFMPDESSAQAIADLSQVAQSFYLSYDDEGWAHVDLGGAFPMRCTIGPASNVDTRKSTEEYIETAVLHSTCGSWSKGGYVLPDGTVFLEWETSGVQLSGVFAWSVYYRIFGNGALSADALHPDEFTNVCFWWEGVDGVRHWWNGSGWVDSEVFFHPAFTRATSYPSATVNTVYPSGTEYQDLKGMVMEHGSDWPVARAFGCKIVKNGSGHWTETAYGSNVDEAFVRDWEIGVGSDRNRYAINRFTGEPKTEYNYRVDSGRDFGDLLEEEFPFHTWNHTQLCSSGLMRADNAPYETALMAVRGRYYMTERHEVWLADQLADLYGRPRRRLTLEVRSDVPYEVLWTHEGKVYKETARRFDPMSGVTRLTVDEIPGEDEG